MRWGARAPNAFTQAQVFLRAEGTQFGNGPSEGYNITIARLRQEGPNENVFRLGIGKPGGETMTNDADAARPVLRVWARGISSGRWWCASPVRVRALALSGAQIGRVTWKFHRSPPDEMPLVYGPSGGG